MTQSRTHGGRQRRRQGWWAAAGLIVLSLVPAIEGSFRAVSLSGGPAMSGNDRYTAFPLPVLLHILTVIPFSILGALQFVPGLRRRHPGWHRGAGRVLVGCGLVVALTGLWMSVYYPRLSGDGLPLELVRLVVGSAMAVDLVLGLIAVRRRQIFRHRVWMLRGYALGMGAGTQVLTNLPWAIAVGPPTGTVRFVLMTAGWVINVLVAEWLIRRGRTARPRRVVPRPTAVLET